MKRIFRTDGLNDKERGRGRASLGPLERDVMEALWATAGVTGKDVFNGLREQREIALTTVLTVLDRLVKKGLVKKDASKTVIIFSPACTKDEFGKKVSADIFKSLFDISTGGASASFVDVLAKTDPVELDRLSELIEKKKKELKKR
jgi:predicted transcriptional regulator